MSLSVSLIGAILGNAAGVVGVLLSLAQIIRTQRAERQLTSKLGVTLRNAHLDGLGDNLSIAISSAIASLPSTSRLEIESGLNQKSEEASNAYLRKILLNATQKFKASTDSVTGLEAGRSSGSPAGRLASIQSQFTLAESMLQPKEKQLAYLGISDRIREELEEVHSEADNKNNSFLLYLHLERIRALAASKERGATRYALQLCEKLEESQRHPLLYYRHGQLLSTLDDQFGAIEKYRQAIQYLNAGEDWSFQPASWLRIALPRSLGFAYWLLASDQPDESSKRAELVKTAYEITSQALNLSTETPRQETMVLNNLLFYAGEFRRLSRQSDQSDWSFNALSRHLARLEQLMLFEDVVSLNTLDTMLRAYWLTGNEDKARSQAAKILELLAERDRFASSNTLPLSEQEEEIRAFAESWSSR